MCVIVSLTRRTHLCRVLQPMTSRLLMDAVKSQGQGPRAPRAAPYHQSMDERVGPPPAGTGLRSDAIMEETKKHALHRQQQELAERKAQMQESAAENDLRSLLSKGRKASERAPRPAGGIKGRLGPINSRLGLESGVEAGQAEAAKAPSAQEEEEGAGAALAVQGGQEGEVAFNVTMPAQALAEGMPEDEDVEGGDEGWDADDGPGGYYDEAYRGRGRGRGRGAFRGRGGRGGFLPGVRGRGGFKARGGVRGRGRGAAAGPVELFAAKKWVNPALAAKEKAAPSDGVAGVAAGGAGGGAGTGAGGGAEASGAGAGSASAGGAGVESGKGHRPVVGQLNLDGDLSSVGKRGLYKSAKWVKASS